MNYLNNQNNLNQKGFAKPPRVSVHEKLYNAAKRKQNKNWQNDLLFGSVEANPHNHPRTDNFHGQNRIGNMTMKSYSQKDGLGLASDQKNALA